MEGGKRVGSDYLLLQAGRRDHRRRQSTSRPGVPWDQRREVYSPQSTVFERRP
jgi:hypothetical protein